MKRVGILGGGQLGRMLLQEAANYPVETWVLENDETCPAAHLCHHFVKGNIADFESVVAFGRLVDVITIEIEAVNADALELLEQEGKMVIPSSKVLRIIQNKITQKQFYEQAGIPTPSFVTTQQSIDVQQYTHLLPAVHKLAVGGYDGKGVQIINTVNDIEKAFDAPAVLEQKIDIDKEIAVMVAVFPHEKIVLFPPVEMIFDPYLNLLDYQVCPAILPEKTLWKTEAIAIQVAKALNSQGLFAIEMLVDRQGSVWVNETAPRVHNSGHHTIEAHFTSQYAMLWRILLGYPPASAEMRFASALVNLIGEPAFEGNASYQGLEEILTIPATYLHIYSKKTTKPGRKMGHVTITGKDVTDVVRKAKMIKETLKVTSS